ncbi:fimbrial protein [Limnobaculum xujianqingii]|uniref:fimbrial protein n=1 Tax=Limnobaculum xujianqingii TaxID=2738837 RepID=UPI0011275B40|nr:fimbrial protein [Limnobaculum xujianqingii]
MKKATLIALATLSLAYTTSASANNTVKFLGEVSTQTCTVDINGIASNPMILLPTVPTSALATQGKTAGATKFTVNLTGCTSESSTTTIKTVFLANNVTTNGNLGNTGSATDVSINLLDSDGVTTLDFTSGFATTSAMTLPSNANSTSQELTAQYYAENGPVSAGSVITSAQYAITYP